MCYPHRMMGRFHLALSYREILLAQALCAAVSLSCALVAQFVFYLHPCELCLLQRYPYVLVLIIALGAAWRVRSERLQCYAVLVVVLLFALDASIAFYHTGVEMDIFKGPDACSNSSSGEQTLEEMRAAIMNAPLVSCKQAMAYFAGMSMAAWNGLAASSYALFSLISCVYARKIAR